MMKSTPLQQTKKKHLFLKVLLVLVIIIELILLWAGLTRAGYVPNFLKLSVISPFELLPDDYLIEICEGGQCSLVRDSRPNQKPVISVTTQPDYQAVKIPTDDLRSCVIDTDCIPVSCGCKCSGCGGFWYEDVINKKYIDDWYKVKECQRPKVCPDVCCPPRHVVCENSICMVKEGRRE